MNSALKALLAASLSAADFSLCLEGSTSLVLYLIVESGVTAEDIVVVDGTEHAAVVGDSVFSDLEGMGFLLRNIDANALGSEIKTVISTLT